ncbi:SRPBCC domain-containing protein [candidate division GN15 bacterium]|nr:SRPBCC domain-containing protein [candidate division GN15 bacterium]
MKTTDDPVVVEQTFDVSVEQLWQAITDVTQMRQWFFENIPSFEPEVGFETRFNIETGERDFLHVWRISEVVPSRLISCDWRYEGYAGNQLVTFELFDEGNQSRLRLTATVREGFQEGIPEFTREACLGGWQYFIQQSLKAYLQNK